ncbi:MAG: putative motility protein [Ruminococcaceae bacterium]|nr:putative motility protein [Oscillospiraceae bacterium]
MEMQIAAMSMSMASANAQNALAIGMMRKTMDSQEQSMELITEMLDNMPSPDGRGQIMDVRA